MKKLIVLIGVLFVVLAAGCADKRASFGPQDVARIKEKANALAENELKRFGAAEEQYKDKVEFFLLEGHPFMAGLGAFTKIYRKYTGYEIKGIYLSDNLTKPVQVDIVYTFDVMCNEYVGARGDSDHEAEVAAMNSNEFSVRRTGQFDVTYYSDFDGEFQAESYLPPRVNFFNDETAKIEEIEFEPMPTERPEGYP